MFGLFKRKPKEKQPPTLLDLNGHPINEGDKVTSLRYDLGECTVILEGLIYYYESVATGERIVYVKMIDAITENQKVLKIGDGNNSKAV